MHCPRCFGRWDYVNRRCVFCGLTEMEKAVGSWTILVPAAPPPVHPTLTLTGLRGLTTRDDGYHGELLVRKTGKDGKELKVYLPITEKQHAILSAMGLEEWC